MRVKIINPFISAAGNVFSTMLGCALVRGPLKLKENQAPMYEVSSFIGLSGQCRGMVLVSVARDTALNIAGNMLGTRPDDLDGDVLDAVGEITNMIVGAAKTQLEEYELNIGLPTVICGTLHSIKFPPGAAPIIIPFESEIGPICIEIGLVEQSTPGVALVADSLLNQRCESTS